MRTTIFEGTQHAAFSDAAAIRHAVFVSEQGFAQEEDLDALDACAIHTVIYEGDRPVATARAFRDGEDGTFHIGRVAVIAPLRGQGIGARLLNILEQAARAQGAARLILGAQLHATKFYEKFGYSPFGGVFDDAGAPHQMMEKRL